MAMMLDVYSRRVVGWSMETHPRTELILAALNMAITQRPPSVVIHYSDRSCQYTSPSRIFSVWNMPGLSVEDHRTNA